MTAATLALQGNAALRGGIRRRIDLAVAIGGSLGSLIALVDVLAGTSTETVPAIGVMFAIAVCGVLGFLGRAPWTPKAYVWLVVAANAVYLDSFGPWFGIGVVYVLAMALAFLFMSPRWSWVVIGALAGTPLMSGALVALGVIAPVSLAVDNARQWERAAVAGITGVVGVAILVRITVQQLVSARKAIEDAARAEREQHVERERVEAEIAAARRAESIAQLGAEVGADIGAALAIIESKARALAAELGSRDARECLGDILEATSNASSTMRSLTVFAPDSHVATCGNASDAAHALPKLVRRTIPTRISLDVTADPDAWVGIATTDLARILANLTLNARDAITDSGRITVRVEKRAEHVEITVRDTGSGMPPEVRAQLFKPFFTTKPIGRGTGLGLATTKVFVDRAGGSIEVESEPGCGTLFRICLPHSQ